MKNLYHRLLLLIAELSVTTFWTFRRELSTAYTAKPDDTRADSRAAKRPNNASTVRAFQMTHLLDHAMPFWPTFQRFQGMPQFDVTPPCLPEFFAFP